MKEFCNLRRGWAGGNLTRLPRPVSSWRATALAWTGPSSRVASSVSHHLPPLGRLPPARVVRSPVAFLVATPRWPPAAALPVWTFCGAQPAGRPPPWCPQGGFCPQAQSAALDTLADWWGLQRHCGGIGGRGLFAPQLTYPGSSWEQGSHLPYTPTGRLR